MDHTYAKKTNIDIENNEPDFVSGESEVEEMMGEDGEDPGREAQEGSTEEADNVSLAPTVAPSEFSVPMATQRLCSFRRSLKAELRRQGPGGELATNITEDLLYN